MQKCIFLLLSLTFSWVSSFSQVNDTILLSEIKVFPKKEKVITIKTSGNEHTLPCPFAKAIVSRMDNVPEGVLSAIYFKFNTGVNFRKDVKWNDTNFLLRLYEVNDQGLPGELLTENELEFKINSDHKGKIGINLRPLYLTSPKSLFIGIEMRDQSITKDFVLKFDQNDSAKTYYKTWDNDIWSEFHTYKRGVTINMILKVETN